MSVFGRRMTPELLAAELLGGLERGEIAFDDDDPADLVPSDVETLRAAVVAAAAANTLDEVRAILAPLTRTAERLRKE